MGSTAIFHGKGKFTYGEKEHETRGDGSGNSDDIIQLGRKRRYYQNGYKPGFCKNVNQQIRAGARTIHSANKLIIN